MGGKDREREGGVPGPKPWREAVKAVRSFSIENRNARSKGDWRASRRRSIVVSDEEEGEEGEEEEEAILRKEVEMK
jgi:hypothetical protein